MKSLEYVKTHIDEFEQYKWIDPRFIKRFLDFLPVSEWEQYGFRFAGEGDPPVPKDWTEENILSQLRRDVDFGWEKCVDERGISSELMSAVVNAWCKVLENGLDLNGNDGYYHRDQFINVAKHYGWKLEYGLEDDS